MPPPLFDSHLDLSWCALGFDRDLTESLETIRQREQGVTDSAARGGATVNFEELRRAGVAVCVGTLLARAMPRALTDQRQEGGPALNPLMLQQRRMPSAGPKRIDLDYGSQAIAYSIAHGQLAWYRLMEQQGHVRILRTRTELDEHWKRWQANPQVTPLGLIVSMEGADPIVNPRQVEEWWAQGLRAAGPVHYGRSAYAVGTGEDGPLTSAGRELLQEFDRLGMIVDVTHLSDTSMAETLDSFSGRVIASHHNCRALVPHQRQLTDDQIRRLIGRDAVIGTVFDAWMLDPNWKIGTRTSENTPLTLASAVDQIDHICQLAGSVRHCGIGSDLDGGFGNEQTPRDLKRYSDLQNLAPLLSARGYTDADINAIFHQNWLRLFREALPE